MWDPSSLIRDRTHDPWSGSSESLTTGPPGTLVPFFILLGTIFCSEATRQECVSTHMQNIFHFKF